MLAASTPGTAPPDDMGIAFEACFVQAVDDAELPDDPEFRGALRDYMHWATARGELVRATRALGRCRTGRCPAGRWDGPQKP